MGLYVKTLQGIQCRESHAFLPGGAGLPSHSHRPKELLFTGFAISPSTFATFVWERLNEGKFH